MTLRDRGVPHRKKQQNEVRHEVPALTRLKAKDKNTWFTLVERFQRDFRDPLI